MVAFHAKALEKGKGKGSLKTIAASNLSAAKASGPSTADGSRNRKRKDFQYRHHHPATRWYLEAPPPPFPIRLESSSPVGTTFPVPTPKARPLALIRGDLQITRGIQISLSPTTENFLSSVPKEELHLPYIEMQC